MPLPHGMQGWNRQNRISPIFFKQYYTRFSGLSWQYWVSGQLGWHLEILLPVIITIPLYLYLARDFSFGSFNKDLFKKYLKISTPVALILIINTLINTSDKVILQSFTNSKQLGYYTAAFTLGSFIKTIELSSGALLFPYFSKSIAKRISQGSMQPFKKLNASRLLLSYPLG